MSRVVIIGAGVVGLACARALSFTADEVFILESGPRIAEGVTSRNSGVIHSPINYPTGSLKASLCARGRELMYEWCGAQGVPHRETGKLIVASNTAETEILEKLQSTARANGAPEITLVSEQELKQIEPSVEGKAALFSPRTGIIDAYEVSRSFLHAAESRGATLVLRAKLQAVTRKSSSFELNTSVGPIEADWVINSAGLDADAVAKMAGIDRYRIYPWRGDYFTFAPDRARSFRHLIYPVKMKSDPGLGVHLTMDLQGRYRLGPDVSLVESKTDFGPPAKLPEKHASFLLAAQKLFPWAQSKDLYYDTCGIRPKLRGPLDTEEKDFVIARDLPGWINLMGIESPGLTASMAIAEQVMALMKS